MDHEARLRRRAEARRRVRRQRLRALGGLLGAGALALLLGLVAGGGDEDGARRGEAESTPRRPELPRGGREILPRHRVVAFYGAPQDAELGVLGIGPASEVGEKLRRQARPYERPGRPVLPAFELIATVAANHPGDDGKYRTRQGDAIIRRYLRAAREAKAILVLDVQPGRADFPEEVRHLERWLREPDVSLALDPEWSMDAGQVPGQVIGDTDAAVVNDVSEYLARIVKRHDLPQKLLVVHQFTDDMIRRKRSLRRHPGVALTLNVDGFGDRPNKLAKYREFTGGPRRSHYGFKLFYREDTDLMRPRDVLRLRPQPEVVVYE